MTVNRHGMRDRPDRTVEKPPDVIRVAAVGSSNVMGYGVRDDEIFSHLLEDRLNGGGPAGRPRYEVLNFGTGKSYAIHRRVLLDRKVFAFTPAVVLYVAHQDEFYGPPQHLTKLVVSGTRLPSPGL